MPELEIALNTGLRRSEQYRLEWHDVDLVRRQLTITHSKNGKIRYIPLNSEALSAFQTLYERSTGKGYVFVSATGSHLRGPRHWSEPSAREAGMNQFTWHDLRHTFASRLVMAGVDLNTVRELLGHQTVQMTIRYAHLAPSHRLKSVEKLLRFQTDHVDPTDTRTDTGTFSLHQHGKTDVQ
ncbi:MAG: site-specific integrase [Acidobacteriaceae bacterium]